MAGVSHQGVFQKIASEFSEIHINEAQLRRYQEEENIDLIAKSLVYKTIRKNKSLFDENKILFIIEFDNNKILLNKLLNEKIFEFLNQKNIYYFKSKLDKDESSANFVGMNTYNYVSNIFPKLKYYFKNIENKFYYYIIFDINQDYIKITNKIILLLNQYNIHHRIIYLKKELFFHSICQNIYACNSINNKKMDKTIFKEKQDYKLVSPDNKMLIHQFCQIINQNEELINNNLSHSYNFLLQSDRDNKYLREEFIVLKSYIEYANINSNSFIELGRENKKWDAKINDLLIEITQAIPKNEFITRKHLAENMYGYKSFSLRLRTKQQNDLDNFLDTIIDTIEKKHKKNYNDNRILIVVILAEYVYYDSDLLYFYIESIKQKLNKGTFKEILLAIDAKNYIRLF